MMLRLLAIIVILAVSSAVAAKECRNKMADLGFIIDSSGSLRAEYHKEKKFVTDIASTIGISDEGLRAGVITFSYLAELSIKLKDHTTTESFNEAAKAIPLMGYTTRIDLALKLAQKDLFTKENGGREGVTKILIVLTDGTQTKARGAVDPGDVAADIRKSGVVVVVIGVGSGIDREELDHMAGGKGKAYVADSFDQLIGEEFVDTIQGSICESEPETPPPPTTPAPSPAPSPARVCWRHLNPGCVNAHNIVRYRGTTVDECKKLCAEHPDCKAFEYGVPHGGSKKTYKPGDCQLNSGSNAKNCDGVKNNLDLYVKIDCKHNVCWKKSSPACARAHNIKRVKDLSLDQCKRLCMETEDCVGFEYGVNHGGSRKHYRPRDCQLNTWKNIKGCDGKHNNLDFYAMKDCETTCYKHISPGCVRAHNIRRVRNKSVAACKSICAITPGCVGFEYGVNHGGARKHYRVGDCQLNTYTRYDNCDGRHNNLDLYLMYDCAKGDDNEHKYTVW